MICNSRESSLVLQEAVGVLRDPSILIGLPCTRNLAPDCKLQHVKNPPVGARNALKKTKSERRNLNQGSVKEGFHLISVTHFQG